MISARIEILVPKPEDVHEVLQIVSNNIKVGNTSGAGTWKEGVFSYTVEATQGI